MQINVLAGLIGYLSFIVAIVIMCLLVYVNADRLEAWARRRFKKSDIPSRKTIPHTKNGQIDLCPCSAACAMLYPSRLYNCWSREDRAYQKYAGTRAKAFFQLETSADSRSHMRTILAT